MATRMQQRRGTEDQWTAADPILAAGEIGFETDTNQFKIGDGVNIWSELSYFKNLEDLGGSLDDYVPVATKAQANGVASLDSTGNIPLSQLGNLIDGAPAALNTLNEIADALDNNGTFASTIITSIATKLARSGGAMGGTLDMSGNPLTNVPDPSANSDAATKGYVDSVSSGNVSSHNAATTNVHGIANTALLVTSDQIANFATTTVVSESLADVAADADTALTNHNLATTEIHGISNTANLVYVVDLSEHTDATTNVHGIADTAALATKNYADSAVSTHNSDTTNVHGIADTALLATLTNVSNAKSEAITDAGTAADSKISTAVAALTKSSVGLGNVDNTSDANKPVSTAQASAIATAKSEAIAAVNDVIASAPAALNTLDELAAALGDDANFATTVTNGLAAKAPLANPTFTGTVTVAANGVAFTDGTQTKAGVPSITTIATAISSSATLAAGEADKFIPLTGAVTITLPATGYSTGQSIDFYQASGTGAQFASTNSVVGTPGLKFRTTNSVVTAMKISSGWLVFGDLSA